MRRLGACTAAGLLGVTGALLVGGAAYAASPPAVTFSGDCGLLGVGARSQPDVTELSVPAMGYARFINGLAIRADLVLPAGKRYTLNPGNYVDLRIASGPAEALMEPACGLGLLPTYQKVTIQVESPAPLPAENPNNPPRSSAPAAPAPPAGRDNAQRPVSPQPRPRSSAEATPRQEASPSPTPPAPSPIAQQPAIDLASGSSSVAEPVAAGEVPDRASSLLAMVATICVVGVSAAAARAITSQRMAT